MKKIRLTIITAVLLMTGMNVQAQDAVEILKNVDEVMFSAKDMTATTSIIITDKNGKESKREATMIQKGMDMRIFKFTAPSSQAGIAVLSLPDNIMYMYLPAYGKERRISSSVKSQNFAGTDFSYDDMEAKPNSEKYNPKYLKTEGDAYILELTPKSSKSPYSKIIMKVNKTHYYPMSAEYYDKANKKVKEGASIYVKIDNYWNAQEMVMTNLKKNHTTKMTMSNVVYDQGLSDDEFTVRMLKQ